MDKNGNYKVVYGLKLDQISKGDLKVFCSDMKFKMAATAGLSLTLDPMGKMFQNASSRWRPSWISDRHKKQKISRGPSNDHS
jgi:hypothetical protein